MSSRFIPGKLYEISPPNLIMKFRDLSLLPINFDEKRIIFGTMNLEYNVVMFLGEYFVSRDEYSTIQGEVLHHIFYDHKFQAFAFYQKFMLGRLIEIL